ncbi:MAG: penicillin-binding protein 2, partial [Sneathia sanguinegens]
MANKNKKNNIKTIHFYFLFIVLFFIIICLKLLYYQVICSGEARKNIEKYRYELEDIYAKRGSIYSSDGHKLAFDVEKYNIILDPMNLDEKFYPDIANILSKYVGKSKEEILTLLQTYRQKSRKFLDFKVEITYDAKQNFEKDLKEYKREAKNNGKGKIIGKWLHFQQKSERFQVEGQEFEAILGFLNSENKPVYGVEYSYNKYLKGEPGKARVYKAATEAVRPYTLQSLIDEQIIKQPKQGADVYLTIDSVLQYSMDEVLKNAFTDFTAESVMGILMEADTGKILAMDSYPKSTNKTEIKNRSITDLFEPGSIFKPITVAAAIEQKLVNKDTIIHSDGFVRVKDRTIHDHDSSTKGDLTINKIIMHSGNVAMVKIVQLMETPTFYNFLKNFGLSQKTGIDIAFETASKLFSLKSFTEVRKSNVSFGQGISMTQMQMLTSLNTTINGGKLLKPFVVDKVVDQDGNILLQNKEVVKHKPISEHTSEQIREMLENVVTSGTGKGIFIPGYRLG